MASVYIAQIDCPAGVAEKINAKHELTLDDVRFSFMWPATGFSVRWFVPTDDDPRGQRVVVRGRTPSGRQIQAVLYPVDEDLGIWRLATAVPMV